MQPPRPIRCPAPAIQRIIFVSKEHAHSCPPGRLRAKEADTSVRARGWWRHQTVPALVLTTAALLAATLPAQAQTRPYIGFVYPAGGQQGTTFAVKLGGQNLNDASRVLVTGPGVSARVVECYRRLNNQEMALLNEQLKQLKQATSAPPATMMSSDTPMMASEMSAAPAPNPPDHAAPGAGQTEAARQLIARIEKRTAEFRNRPASVALASLVFIEVSIAPDAQPGQRELRIRTPQGVSNPMVFCVGQLPEHTRKPMLTSNSQVLGKEALALRKRPPDEVQADITLPCVLNGQIASGEVNQYRFSARKGQRLVISTLARQLIPFIADAVPGWFQPVLVLRHADGTEAAYQDDYRFNPDPTILCEVPRDGEYVLTIHDSIYRGREDFVYRISLGELPFITSIFPLGARAGAPATIRAKGWNLTSGELSPPPTNAAPGVQLLSSRKQDLVSNPVPFALDALPDSTEREPNYPLNRAQQLTLPRIVNGRMDQPGDWDLFRFNGRAGQTIAAEVFARRLDSPLDSVLKLTDDAGKLLAWNDDCEDLGAGVNTHHADSLLLAKLPADGTYCVHLGDTARNAGPEYAYRLCLRPAKPDFALRVAPSSISLRARSSASLSVHALRHDGFTGPIRISLNNAPPGFSANTVSLSGTQTVVRLNIKTSLTETTEPIHLTISGSAKIGDHQISHDAVPAEDRMQAFLWRHLVPASEMLATVYDPAAPPKPGRTLPPLPAPVLTGASPDTPGSKPKFTRQQIASRLRELKLLFEEGLLTENFYARKVAECDPAL